LVGFPTGRRSATATRIARDQPLYAPGVFDFSRFTTTSTLLPAELRLTDGIPQTIKQALPPSGLSLASALRAFLGAVFGMRTELTEIAFGL
jgi:hypothetical protein